MARVGKWLTLFGIVVTLVCVVLGVVFAVTGFGKVSDISGDAFVVDGSVTRQFDGGDEIYLYGADAVAAFDRPSCTASGPAPTTAIHSNYDSSFTYNGRSVRSTDGIRFTEPGAYTLTCDTWTVAAPKLATEGIFQGVGGVLLAVFGGSAGLFFIFVGGILWIVGVSTRKPPPMPYNYPPSGGYPNYPPGGPGNYPSGPPPGNWNR